MTPLLAFDAGGTRTRGGLYDEHRNLVAEHSSRGANPVIIGIDACVSTIVDLSRQLLSAGSTEPAVVACGLAGWESSGSGEIIAQAIQDALAPERTILTDDMTPLLFANAGTNATVVVIAGTGSSIKAQTADGRSLVLSGRGTIFGDDGSAHQVAIAALRAAADAVDGVGPATTLVDALARAVHAPDFPRLVQWTNAATKDQIAALAQTVTHAADAGDPVADACVQSQAERLAKRTAAAFTRLSLPAETPLLLNGGLFERSERYRNAYAAALDSLLPGVRPHLADLRGHRAVLELALADQIPPRFPAAIASRQRTKT